MANEDEDNEQPEPHYEGGIPILPGQEEREESARRAEKKEEREYRDRQVSIQRGIFKTQVLLVFFGILGTGISIYQANTARDSANQARRAADMASDSFEINDGNFDRMMRQTVHQTAAEVQSAQDAGKAVKEAQLQTEKMDAARTDSEKQSEDALRVARDAMYAEQRPWVDIEVIQAEPTKVGIGNVTTAVSFVAHNTGRTPAVRFRDECCINSNQAMPYPIPDYDTLHGDIDSQLSPPDRTRIQQFPESEAEIKEWFVKTRTDFEQQRARDNQKVIAPGGTAPVANWHFGLPKDEDMHFILGRFVYWDVLDPTKMHVTKYCLVQWSNTPIELCTAGQDMN